MRARTFLIIMLLFWGINACGSQPRLDPTTTLPIASPTPLPTSLPTVPYLTPTITKPAIPLPTSTLEVTSAIKPSPSVTPEETPTSSILVGLPDLSINQAKEALEGFVETNGGCKLPCLITLSPAGSSIQDFWSYLNYFGQNTHQSDSKLDGYDLKTYEENPGGNLSLTFWKDNVSVSFDYDFVYSGNNFWGSLYTYMFQQAEGGSAPLYDHPYNDQLVKSYSLPHILDTYGPPDQVLIWVFTNFAGHQIPSDGYPLDFVLFYPQKGFLVEYLSWANEGEGFYSGCPSHSPINLAVWNPGKPRTLAQAAAGLNIQFGINSHNADHFKPIQDASNFSMAKFYSTFSKPDSKDCIQTPINLWNEDN